ncbi:MAG: hypothetical protein ACRDWG_17460 [Actinomycetes bacterium]
MSETDDWDEEPVLPEQTVDDTDAAWGEGRESREQDQDDLERLLEDRPPHHDR